MEKLVGKLSAVGGLSATLSAKQGLQADLSLRAIINLQQKTVIPQDEEQQIVADEGYFGLLRVTVGAIPNNYGRIIYNGIITIV